MWRLELGEAVMIGAATPKKATIICWSDHLDKVYPQLILATTAAAYGVEVTVFIDFWGILVFKKKNAGVTGKNMTTKMIGLLRKGSTDKLKLSRMNMGGLGTWMMKRILKKENVASLETLIEMAMMSGVKFVPCQGCLDAFGLKQEDLIDGMEQVSGASAAVGAALESQINWFI